MDTTNCVHQWEKYRSKTPSVAGGYEYIEICKLCGEVQHAGYDCYCWFCGGYDHNKYSTKEEVLEKMEEGKIVEEEVKDTPKKEVEPQQKVIEENNHNKKPMVRKITPKVIKTFSLEDRLLFRAGLIDENRNWTEDAHKIALELLLDKSKKQLCDLANELIKEEREDMMMGLWAGKQEAE